MILPIVLQVSVFSESGCAFILNSLSKIPIHPVIVPLRPTVLPLPFLMVRIILKIVQAGRLRGYQWAN